MVDQEIFGSIISLFQEISSDLNSEQFYYRLYQDDDDLREYYSECIPLTSSYMSTNIHSRLRRTCALLVKYLKTKSIKLDRNNLAYDDCILLNYWVYSSLVNIFGSNDASTLAVPFGTIQRIWNGIVDKLSGNSRNNICKPDIGIATQIDWRKRKELYDYCVNYDQIKSYLPLYNDMCPKYWNYVESHTSLYEYFEKHYSEKTNQLPEFYDECKQYDPRDVLESFDCHAKMKQKKDEEAAANARPALPASISADQEQNSRILGGLQSPHNGTHTAKKTGDILLGVVATSLTSGALYRFTPLGRIVRNGFGWNNNNMRNIHGGEYGLFDYTSESFNPYTGGGEEHYIGYHPA